MSYEFQGKTFELKKNMLDLYKNIAPLLSKRNTLIYEYTKDIDMKPYLEQVSRINRVKGDIERLKDNPELVKKHTERLEKLQTELDTDSKVRALLSYKAEQIEAAMFELATDKELLKEVFPKMLDGETEILNFEEATMELLDFIFKVLGDFFLLMPKSRNV